MRPSALGLLATLALAACSAPPEGRPAAVPDTSEVSGTLGEASPALSPEPPRPAGRPAESADAALVAIAREVMGGDARRERCGLYALVTDVLDMPLLAACARLAGKLDDVFEERYGVEPVGDPKATILPVTFVGIGKVYVASGNTFSWCVFLLALDRVRSGAILDVKNGKAHLECV